MANRTVRRQLLPTLPDESGDEPDTSSSSSSAGSYDLPDPTIDVEDTLLSVSHLAPTQEVDMSREEKNEASDSAEGPGPIDTRPIMDFIVAEEFDSSSSAESTSEPECEVTLHRQVDQKAAGAAEIDFELERRLMTFPAWTDVDKFRFYLTVIVYYLVDKKQFNALMSNPLARPAALYFHDRMACVADAAQSSVWPASVVNAVYTFSGRTAKRIKTRADTRCAVCHRRRMITRRVKFYGARYDARAWLEAWGGQLKVEEEKAVETPGRGRRVLDSDSDSDSESGDGSVDGDGCMTGATPDDAIDIDAVAIRTDPHDIDSEIGDTTSSSEEDEEDVMVDPEGWDSDDLAAHRGYMLLDDEDNDDPLPADDVAAVTGHEVTTATLTMLSGRMCSDRLTLAHRAIHWSMRLVLMVREKIGEKTGVDAINEVLDDGAWMRDRRGEFDAFEAQRLALVGENTGGNYKNSYKTDRLRMGSHRKAPKARKKVKKAKKRVQRRRRRNLDE